MARNIGEHDGERIIEAEEMVVETPKFSYEDYLDIRVIHMLMTVFFYEGNFEEASRFAASRGVRPFRLIHTQH